MSVRKAEESPSTSQTKQKNVENDHGQANVTVEAALNKLAINALSTEENEKTRAKIFNLDVDSTQEVFDWLSIMDIESVSETCTRMKRITGDYFQPNLAALKLAYDGDFKTFHGDVTVNGFKEFVQKLEIRARINDEGYRFIGLYCKSLKQIVFFVSRLTQSKIDYLKSILQKIESVKLLNVEGEFYERFLPFCPNLKHLLIKIVNFHGIIGVNNQWLLRSYPKLEHLELRTRKRLQIPELVTFFERNFESLKALSIGDDVFLQNINAMLETNIKLEVLTLGLYEDEDAIFRHLKQLYDRRFYQRLHLNVFSCNQQVIDKIVSLNGLEKLYLNLSSESPQLNLNSFTKSNLKELGLNYTVSSDPFPIDLESTAKSLVNLKRIYFDSTKAETIEPFIQYSATLKAIKIDYLDEECLDLSSLNKKRLQLDGAEKVTIYVEEKEYLATKWGNKAHDFKMIEVKRAQSHDWYMPYSFY